MVPSCFHSVEGVTRRGIFSTNRKERHEGCSLSKPESPYIKISGFPMSSRNKKHLTVGEEHCTGKGVSEYPLADCTNNLDHPSEKYKRWADFELLFKIRFSLPRVKLTEWLLRLHQLPSSPYGALHWVSRKLESPSMISGLGYRKCAVDFPQLAS